MSATTFDIVPPAYFPREGGGLPPTYSQRPSAQEQLIDSTMFAPPPYSASRRASTSSYQPSTSTSTSPGSSSTADSGNEDYVFRSDNIELFLKRNESDLKIPSYGRGGVMRGSLVLKKHRFVNKIVIKLEGYAQTALTQAGLPLGRTSIQVLNLGQILYTHRNGEQRPCAARTYPFEFIFPENIQNGNTPLPMTFRAVQPGIEGNVRYTLKVHVFKAGLWPGENLNVTVHYLPKTRPDQEALIWPRISLMDAKRFGVHCNANWKTTEAVPKTTVPEGTHVYVSIPRTAQAVAAECFQVNVTLRTPDKKLLQSMVDNTLIRVIRSVELQAEGYKSAHTCGIGRGRVQQIEYELAGENERIIRGGAAPGVKFGESSWNIGDLIAVNYCMQVVITDPVTKEVLFHHDEPIELFSHPNSNTGFEEWDQPATNLLLGTSLHAGTPAFR